MEIDEKEQTGSTRRGFFKELAVGGGTMAVAGAMLGWTADAREISQGVSPETSDGKSRYGKCIVPLPIRKMGETVMFSAGADLLNGFPCNIIYAFGLKVGPLGLSRKPHIHDHDEVIYFIGSDPKSSDLGGGSQFQNRTPGRGGRSYLFRSHRRRYSERGLALPDGNVEMRSALSLYGSVADEQI